MITPLELSVVLLAAGLSSRMRGRNKLLIDIGGEALVRRVARVYLGAGARVHVVLGHDADNVRAALGGLPVLFVENARYTEGQAASVQAGLATALAGGAGDAVLMSLGDQAALEVGDIRALLQAFADSDRTRAVVPQYQGQRGNPVVFPPTVAMRMLAEGARGRGFLDAHPELAWRMETGNDHFIRDIDTPEDLAAFQGASIAPMQQENDGPTNRDLWVFGYGSLMWRPGFDHTEAVHAQLHGAHRSLCIYSHMHRGTPRRPGLVLGLDCGGTCEGIAFRVCRAKAAVTLAYLRRRELVRHVYRPILRRVALRDGTGRTVVAQCYMVNRAHPQYAGDLPFEVQARLVRRGRGMSGANIDYVLNTVRHLREAGVIDWRLEALLHRLGRHREAVMF